MYKINQHYSTITDITNNIGSLGNISSTLNILNQLNQIFKDYIPTNLQNHCYVGAIDLKKELVIVFIKDQQIYQQIYNLGQLILQKFKNHNFNFSGIQIKVSSYKYHVTNDNKPEDEIML